MGKKFKEIYLTYYSLLIAQDLWQAHYQILSIISPRKFTELYVNSDMTIKNVKHMELQHDYCNCFLEYTSFKDDLIEYKSLCYNKIYQHKFDKKLKKRFLNTYKFSNHDY